MPPPSKLLPSSNWARYSGTPPAAAQTFTASTNLYLGTKARASLKLSGFTLQLPVLLP
jgi:hypothetical protein